jgi:hypothetical protein
MVGIPSPAVTIVIVTWNSRQHIDECLGTMLNQSYSNHRVLVLDSCSSDGTPEHIRANFPKVEVIELPTNMGYRRGGAYGMQLATGKYVVICNDDVKVGREWLAEMVRAMEEDNSIGLVAPMILLDDQPTLINAAGNTLHFSGMYGPRAKGQPRQLHESPRSLAAVSGCCFMIRHDLMLQLGGFSTDFDQLETGWHASFEDVDLGWRAQMLGYRIEYVPTSIVYHKYVQPGFFASRFGSYEWGRYLTIFRDYSICSLVVLLPLLLVLELVAWTYALLRGMDFVKAKARVMAWFFWHPRKIWDMRQRVQTIRTRPDLEIVSRMDPILRFSGQFGGKSIARAIDSVFGLVSQFYYWAFKSLLSVCSSKG